ncbi:MAG: hypothetical protein HQK67_02165 [Desulfamplus sp.]|nr:hypothetical protein [Desulfamplus sp.]
MSKLFSIEFWIAAQLFIDLVLLMLLWKVFRKINKVELELQNVIRHDDIEFLTDSIHQNVLERIDKLTTNMAKNAAVEMVDRAAQDIIDLLDPLVKGSESAANAFDHQIKEKQRLIKGLNDALDSRIISINLLLSRTEVILNSQDKSIYQHSSGRSKSALGSGDKSSELRPNPFYNQEKAFKQRTLSDINKSSDYKLLNSENSNQYNVIDKNSNHYNVIDQQQQIIEWYQQGLDVDTIASRLAMPRGEVQLIISLKEKFIKMENLP